MANKKQSPRKGVPYRFQGNEAIGTETISSTRALWGRDDVFCRAPCPCCYSAFVLYTMKRSLIVRMIGDRNKCYEQILLALFVLIDYLKCLSVRFNFVNVNNPNCINLCPKERPRSYFFHGLSLHLCHWGALATSLKKRITFFQSSSRVFQITYLVNCRRALGKLNSYE